MEKKEISINISNYRNLPRGRQNIRKIKRDRLIRKFSKSELLASLITGLVIILVISPLIIFYVVTSKTPLDIERSGDDDIDQIIVITEGIESHLIDVQSLKETQNQFDIVDEVTLYTFGIEGEGKQTDLFSLCRDLKVQGIHTAIVFAFDYLLPYITYDCSNKGIVIYGHEIEGEQSMSPSIIDRFTWSLEIFFN